MTAQNTTGQQTTAQAQRVQPRLQQIHRVPAWVAQVQELQAQQARQAAAIHHLQQRPQRRQPSETVVIPRTTYRMLVGGFIAGAIILALGFLAALGAAIGKPATPAAPAFPNDSHQVTAFNDGWDTGLQDLQQMWQDDHQRVGQCLSEAQPAQLHGCLSTTK